MISHRSISFFDNYSIFINYLSIAGILRVLVPTTQSMDQPFQPQCCALFIISLHFTAESLRPISKFIFGLFRSHISMIFGFQGFWMSMDVCGPLPWIGAIFNKVCMHAFHAKCQCQIPIANARVNTNANGSPIPSQQQKQIRVLPPPTIPLKQWCHSTLEPNSVASDPEFN